MWPTPRIRRVTGIQRVRTHTWLQMHEHEGFDVPLPFGGLSNRLLADLQASGSTEFGSRLYAHTSACI